LLNAPFGEHTAKKKSVPLFKERYASKLHFADPTEHLAHRRTPLAGIASSWRAAFVFVKNRLEGNAPSTIEAVVDRIGLHLAEHKRR
jgi:hypothetical protein